MRAYSPLSQALHQAVQMVVDSGFTRGAYVIYGTDHLYHPCLSMEFHGLMKALVAMSENGKLLIVRM